jgi:hypothetical protein
LTVRHLGNGVDVASDVEIERALEALAATLNDPPLDGFDTRRVQAIVDAALGGQRRWTVDSGGGLHDETARRVGAMRRTPSGEWIIDRQNAGAARSETPIPSEHA